MDLAQLPWVGDVAEGVHAQPRGPPASDLASSLDDRSRRLGVEERLIVVGVPYRPRAARFDDLRDDSWP
ncbi:MAG: hypothetical protein ACRDSO_08525 [Pseudonocardiaceae bacterium]